MVRVGVRVRVMASVRYRSRKEEQSGSEPPCTRYRGDTGETWGRYRGNISRKEGQSGSEPPCIIARLRAKG